jgi:hypothetical protein
MAAVFRGQKGDSGSTENPTASTYKSEMRRRSHESFEGWISVFFLVLGFLSDDPDDAQSDWPPG